MRFARDKKCIRLLSLRLCSVLLLTHVALASGNQSSSPLDVKKAHGRLQTDLANALVFISTEYRVPVIAELMATENPTLDIPAAKETARDVLNLLAFQTPQYTWTEQAGVVHFYLTEVLDSVSNPLNLTLSFFQMPTTVSDLKIILPTRLYNASHGLQHGGAALSAFPSDELNKQELSARTFHDSTGRDILLAAADVQPHFSSIIVLSNLRVSKEAGDWDYAFAHWFWFAVDTRQQPIIR